MAALGKSIMPLYKTEARGVVSHSQLERQERAAAWQMRECPPVVALGL